MEQRHRQFLHYLVEMTDPETRPLIECAIKEYVIIEGPGNFFNRAKALAGNLKNKISTLASQSKQKTPNSAYREQQQPTKATLKHREFTPEQEKARQYLINLDKSTWDHDYERFQLACDDILYFLKNYGNREFNQLRQTDDFKKAEKRGNLLDDYIRINPQKLKDERHEAYRNIMDAIGKISPEKKALIESIMSIYYITEGVTRTKVIPVFESSNRDYMVSQLKNDMAAVEVFVTKHGIYPWKKFLNDREFRDAYMNSAKLNPDDNAKDSIDPKLVNTVRDSFSSGYGAAMEANDAGTDKLEKYLNRKPESDIKDKDGYIDTTKKAFNYFENARKVEGEWAVHFTNEEVYEKIKKNGFSHGTSVLDHLAYTSHFPDGRTRNGWLFAVPVDTAFLKHYDMRYGDYAFLIKTDGVLTKHVGERDMELLFRRKDVIETIPFYFDKETKKWTTDFGGEQEDKSFSTIGKLVDKYAINN